MVRRAWTLHRDESARGMTVCWVCNSCFNVLAGSQKAAIVLRHSETCDINKESVSSRHMQSITHTHTHIHSGANQWNECQPAASCVLLPLVELPDSDTTITVLCTSLLTLSCVLLVIIYIRFIWMCVAFLLKDETQYVHDYSRSFKILWMCIFEDITHCRYFCL